MSKSETEPSRSKEATGLSTSVSVINRQLNVRPFETAQSRIETANRWEKWVQNIERQFRYFEITEPDLKKDGLIIYGGQTLADLEETLPDLTDELGVDNVYTEHINKLNKHFLLKKNKDFARFQFGNLKQDDEESLPHYYTRIKDIARECGFYNGDEAIRDHLIKTMINNSIRIKEIRKNWTLDEMLEEVELDEEIRKQANEIETKLEEKHNVRRIRRFDNKRQQRDYSQERAATIGSCTRCGNNRSHIKCPADSSICHACGKRNHFARVCRSKSEVLGQNNREGREFPAKHQYLRGEKSGRTREREKIPKGKWSRKKPFHLEVKHVTDERVQSSSHYESSTTSSSDEDLVSHLKIFKTSKEKNKPTSFYRVRINGQETPIEPDTGADSNIMDEVQLRRLAEKTPNLDMHQTEVKLNTLQNQLPVGRECTVTVENETRQAQAQFVIVKGKINSLPLLGRATLEELGMVKIDPSGRFKEPNKPGTNIRKVAGTRSTIDLLLESYQELFHGIGRAIRDGKEIQLHLPTKEDATPVAQKPRRVAYHLMEPLRKRLDEFIEHDIMEKVPDQEPITWCSPTVVQPKPKNQNNIRVNLDLRTLNKSMLRTRQVQAPITEDFVDMFRDCTTLSKLDLNHGFHQFVLDPESRSAMTLPHLGGITDTSVWLSEESTVKIYLMLKLQRFCLVYPKRSTIGTISWLVECIKSIMIEWSFNDFYKDHNLTLRREKCEFGKPTLEFHGHLFTTEGLKPTSEKVHAVNACAPPSTKEELRSFLQMVAYLSRYIPRFSGRYEPLRRLTKENVKFALEMEQQNAFEDVKEALITAPVLVLYHPRRDTMIVCDGSPEGSGGALFQKTSHGYKPVHYVSRTLHRYREEIRADREGSSCS